MSGLVLHHVGDHRAAEGVLGDVADQPEGGEREPLDENLHPEVGHVPAAVGDDVVEQRLEVWVDRVGELQLLLQVARVRLDVARLVHHLGGGVELAVDVGNRLHDLRGADQRALLAVEELREVPRGGVVAELAAGLLVHRVPHRRAPDGDVLLGCLQRVGEVDLVRPVDPLLGVPLQLLALLVEVEQLVPPLVVLPVEDGDIPSGDLPAGLLNRKRVGAGAHDELLSAGSGGGLV